MLLNNRRLIFFFFSFYSTLLLENKYFKKKCPDIFSSYLRIENVNYYLFSLKIMMQIFRLWYSFFKEKLFLCKIFLYKLDRFFFLFCFFLFFFLSKKKKNEKTLTFSKLFFFKHYTLMKIYQFTRTHTRAHIYIVS